MPVAQSQSAGTAISPSRADDFAGWYQEVVRAAELATMAHVRGCMVIRPWGYRMWELMQAELDRQIRARRHSNVYFPLLIPVSYIQSEADHVEGFAKEMAVVTHHRLEDGPGRSHSGRPAGGAAGRPADVGDNLRPVDVGMDSVLP